MQPDSATMQTARERGPAADDAVFLTSAVSASGGKAVVLSVNTAFERLTGVDAAGMTGRPVDELPVLASPAGHAMKRVREGMARGQPVGPLEIPRPRRDGATALVEIILDPVRDAHGTVTNFVGILRDVARHADAADMTWRIVEHAPAGMLMVDAAGAVALANAEAVRIFGYSRDELLGLCIDDLVPTEARAAHARQRAAYTASPSARSMGRQRDLEGVRRDGVRVPVEVGLVPFSLSSGQYVLASVVDISARKAAEAEQARLRDELAARNAELASAVERANKLAADAQAANRAKSSFLAAVSHELNTPLTAIIGFGDLLQQQVHGALGDERYADYAATITDSGRRMQTLIARVMELTRATAGTSSVVREDVDARQILERAIGEAQSRRGEDAPAIVMTPEHGRLPVAVDPKTLRRIADELIANAIDHSYTDGTVRVAATARDDGGLDLEVADAGPGMTERTAAAAMHAFEQPSTAYTRHQAGLGIGLSLANALATAHGGGLNLETAKDAGTTVHVRLPGAEGGAGRA